MEGDCRSRIPSLLRRSASVRVRGERHPVASSCCSQPSADGDSVGSTTSLVSCGSATQPQQSTTPVETAVSCHRRGSCRSVLHCQRPVETDHYLTPTQRKDRELRQLRTALARATTEARLRDERLRELTAQLQSLKTSQGMSVEGSSVEEHAAEGVSLGDSGISSDVLPSHTESVPEEEPELEGGDEDSTGPQAAPEAASGLPENQAASGESDDSTESFPEEGATRRRPSAGSETLRRKYRQLKHRYEQRTESLLQMLGDLNANIAEKQPPPPPCEQQGPPASRRADALWQHVSTCQSTCITRYLELRPAYESTQERLRHLERELSEARAEIEKQERWHSEMYLKMYRKGQEAAQFERNEELQHHRAEAPSPSAPPAFRGVPGTERQAEYTLRFLKDAVYYFLTDRSDCRGHLSAIQSILGFSEAERAAVAKAWRHRGRL